MVSKHISAIYLFVNYLIGINKKRGAVANDSVLSVFQYKKILPP